ncbi:MAG: hypothetical protein IKP00_06510 [Victivallales bacterium]|nr:hypothetical protein [Victivallales bacterium]
MTLSLIQDAPCRFAALRGKAHGDWGGHLTVGFASPLSRLRFTHGYALAVAYAASLFPRLCSCRRGSYQSLRYYNVGSEGGKIKEK